LLRTNRNGALAMLFLFLTLPIGVFLAGTVPLGHVADETAHLLRADGLLYGGIIGHREPVTLPDGRRVVASGVPADMALLSVVTLPIRPVDPAPQAITAEMVQRARAVSWPDHPTFVNLSYTASYMPLFYLPAAIALGVAKLVGIAPFQAFIAARLANLLCFAGMGSAALLVARRGQIVMFWTLAVPMTLNLAASASQDGLLIASSVLAAALISRASEDAALRAVSRSPWYWTAAVLIACVATVKPPYLPLAAMLLLPLPIDGDRRPSWHEFGRRAVAIVLVCLPVFGWTWLAIHHASVPRMLDPYEAGPLWPGPRPAVFENADVAAQLRVLMAAPTRFFTLPLLHLWYDNAMPSEIIGVLGWLNLALPHMLYVLWTVALVAAIVGDCVGPTDTTGTQVRWAEFALLLGTAVAAIFGIYISQYLIWTPVGMPWIGGPQGRYLLPLFPLLALALPRLGLPGGARLRRALLALPLAAAAANVLMLPRLIVGFYYLS
jgi:hypothetical protein